VSVPLELVTQKTSVSALNASALNPSIAWQFEVQGGTLRLNADLRGLQLAMVTLEGGAIKVDLALPSYACAVDYNILGNW